MIPIDAGPRQNGKSTRTLLWLAEDLQHRAVVVPDFDRVKHMVDLAKRLGIEGVTRHHFVLGLRAGAALRGTRYEVRIDQADHLLEMLIGQPVEGVTWTVDEVTP